jgi:hypothetical protein
MQELSYDHMMDNFSEFCENDNLMAEGAILHI